MTLSHKERLRRAIRYEPIDRLPTQINYTGKMAARMADAYGVTAGALPVHLDNHLVRVDMTYPARFSADGVASFDWWGAGFDTREEGYFVCVSPLQETPDLDAFAWPDPHAPGLLDDARRIMATELGQRAENNFAGVNCGILDQYTSAVGKAGSALLLDARTVTSEDIPLAPDIRIVICDTHTKRELAGSEYGRRRAQCEAGAGAFAAIYPGVTHLRDVSLAQFEKHAGNLDPTVARRCRFIVEENARVAAFAVALAAGDRAAVRDLCAASFAGAREHYEITSCEMQVMLAAMRAAPGCLAARQAGAGFGGCLAAFVEAGAEPTFAAHVASAYRAATGIEPRIYAVAPSAGAGLLL